MGVLVDSYKGDVLECGYMIEICFIIVWYWKVDWCNSFVYFFGFRYVENFF